MADFTLPTDGPDRNLLLGVLAYQLHFVDQPGLQAALQTWGADRTRPLGQVLVDRNALSPRRRALLDDLVREYLQQHDMDAARGLAALCAARALELDLAAMTTPALRGNLATLPTTGTKP